MHWPFPTAPTKCTWLLGRTFQKSNRTLQGRSPHLWGSLTILSAVLQTIYSMFDHFRLRNERLNWCQIRVQGRFKPPLCGWIAQHEIGELCEDRSRFVSSHGRSRRSNERTEKRNLDFICRCAKKRSTDGAYLRNIQSKSNRTCREDSGHDGRPGDESLGQIFTIPFLCLSENRCRSWYCQAHTEVWSCYGWRARSRDRSTGKPSR